MSSSLSQKMDYVKKRKLLNVMHDNYPWICQGFVHQQFQTISENKKRKLINVFGLKSNFPIPILNIIIEIRLG